MKKMMKYGFLAFIALQWMSCDEIPPDISFNCDTERKVIIEEFTGVKCVNCPIGSEKLEELKDIYGDQVIPIGIHAGFFSVPFNDSPEDFTTGDGEDIDALLGPATGWPAAVINRKLFTGESTRILGTNAWAGKIQEELCEEPLATVEIETSYDATSRELDITVEGASINGATFSSPVGLVVMITQNNIIAPQVTPTSSKDTAYVHKHVLRDVLTTVDGKNVHGGDGTALTYDESFTYTLESHWVPEDCEVIAFLNYQGGGVFDVIQAEEAYIIE